MNVLIPMNNTEKNGGLDWAMWIADQVICVTDVFHFARPGIRGFSEESKRVLKARGPTTSSSEKSQNSMI